MSAILPLARMTLPEKLRAMEALWEDLSRRDAVTSPGWHREVLEAREKRREKPVPWEAAKRRLRRRS